MKHLPLKIRWSEENEERARKCYIENRKDVGELMEALPSGLHLMIENAYLGASTDAIVVCRSVNTCCIGCLKTKCPYSIDGNVTVEISPQNIAEKFDNFSQEMEQMVNCTCHTATITVHKFKVN